VPRLAPGDLVIDAGNSYFRDTERREAEAVARGLLYLGLGISGGERGARFGPSLMPGGSEVAYQRVQKLLEDVAARVDDVPCVAYLGRRSAGHYVKMVHNAIEYGLMELIAESYDLMRRGARLSNDELAEVYGRWSDSELGSYLLEITARIFRRRDERTGKRLVDRILPRADQQGTGRWASQDAMELGVPVPTIDAAVSMRQLSGGGIDPRERLLLAGPSAELSGDRWAFVEELRSALYAGTILTFAQGAAQLAAASERHGYGIDLATVVRVWRGGCIIRARVLELIGASYRDRPGGSSLLLDPRVAREVSSRRPCLRQVVCTAADLGVPAPGLMSALGYLDAHRSESLPANLIQAQRDYFGAHTYRRNDAAGVFHTAWDNDEGEEVQ